MPLPIQPHFGLTCNISKKKKKSERAFVFVADRMAEQTRAYVYARQDMTYQSRTGQTRKDQIWAGTGQVHERAMQTTITKINKYYSRHRPQSNGPTQRDIPADTIDAFIKLLLFPFDVFSFLSFPLLSFLCLISQDCSLDPWHESEKAQHMLDIIVRSRKICTTSLIRF